MIYNEWIEGKSSLFGEINSIKSFPFITANGAETLDLLYKVKYGTRIIPKSVENLTVQELAKILVTIFGDSWNNRYALLTEEMLLGVDSKTIVNETISDDTKRLSISNQTNKMSAFNDDDLSTNSSNEDNVNDNIQKEYNKNTVTTHTSMNAIKSQLELMNSHFIDSVLEDVSKIISLSIY